MTEREYILATDIRSCDIICSVLRHIVQENNEMIPRDEYVQVFRIVTGWREKTSKALESRSKK